MGRSEDVLVPLLRLDPPIHRVVHHRFAKEPYGCFLLRQVDVLSLAGAPPVMEGRQNGSKAA